LSETTTAWTELTAHLTELETLGGVSALLAWDQQTNMPPAAGASRGKQLALISRMQHERLTDPRVGAWLDTLEASKTELSPLQAAGVRNLRMRYDRSVKLSSDLVERFARAESDGFTAWVQAKQNNDFAAFAPNLQLLLDLTLEKTQAIDSSRHPYDVLLDDFDPGMTVAQLKPLFARLRDGLVQLLDAIAAAEQLAPVDELFPVAGQRALHAEVMAALGYDLQSGRLDPAEHPFTIGIAPGDVRITTHYYEDDLLSGLGGTIHEAGHGMYEQGLPVSFVGTGVRDAASLGLHESQSRFWENTIGRSQAFCNWLEAKVQHHFPDTGVTSADLYRGSNRVEPGLIRVAADEVTYNLHIIVRFELELGLLEGTIAVADLPDAWNARYQEYLGVRPPTDAKGVLQDVHWSGGAFGYFPSYTLGNLYAASLGNSMIKAIPDLWARVERGDFAPVLAWLREHVHSKAHLQDAPLIVADAVGERDAVEDLLTYLWGRHGALYGLTRPV